MMGGVVDLVRDRVGLILGGAVTTLFGFVLGATVAVVALDGDAPDEFSGEVVRLNGDSSVVIVKISDWDGPDDDLSDGALSGGLVYETYDPENPTTLAVGDSVEGWYLDGVIKIETARR
ncbi:MAG: hypothetical protein KKE65_10360 [Actinobacteria bacterium]|jgi:hypothetical protein|nr:hypothetical protein [Actinomycetota bacterium]MBU2112050.1 hypothetical protein [Actinomycetota bacterium]